MTVAEDEGTKFHDTEEPSQIENFCVRIASVKNAGKVKELGSVVYFSPKSPFKYFFSGTEACRFFNQIKVSKNTDDLLETVGLKDVKKFKCFLKIISIESPGDSKSKPFQNRMSHQS